MDELLTDLKSHDEHQVLGLEAKAGGREAAGGGGRRRVEYVVLGSDAEPSKSGCGGREGPRVQGKGCGEECVLCGQRALRVL